MLFGVGIQWIVLLQIIIANSKFWRKGTEAINALIQNWSYECNWLVPPPCMARKVIRKFCEDRANGALVVPLWKSASYWVLLYESNGGFKSFIKIKHYLTDKKNYCHR